MVAPSILLPSLSTFHLRQLFSKELIRSEPTRLKLCALHETVWYRFQMFKMSEINRINEINMLFRPENSRDLSLLFDV